MECGYYYYNILETHKYQYDITNKCAALLNLVIGIRCREVLELWKIFGGILQYDILVFKVIEFERNLFQIKLFPNLRNSERYS